MRISYIAFICFLFKFSSCKGQPDNDSICIEKLKTARNIVYKPTSLNNSNSLDSALLFTNQALLCGTTRKAAADLKISILAALRQYPEGLKFIDSLSVNDFTYSYKKKMNYLNFLALQYNFQNDTIKRNTAYQDIANFLEKYIQSHQLDEAEFKEIYIDLYSVKANFLSPSQINEQVDSLVIKYPDKKNFFDFFRK